MRRDRREGRRRYPLEHAVSPLERGVAAGWPPCHRWADGPHTPATGCSGEPAPQVPDDHGAPAAGAAVFPHRGDRPAARDGETALERGATPRTDRRYARCQHHPIELSLLFRRERRQLRPVYRRHLLPQRDGGSPNCSRGTRRRGAVPANAEKGKERATAPFACRQGAVTCTTYSIASSSTSKISVAFGGIVGGDPRGP